MVKVTKASNTATTAVCVSFLFFSLLLGSVFLQEAHASSVTQTIKTSAYDAYLYASGATYATVWNNPTADYEVSNSSLLVGGQWVAAGLYRVYRTFFYFDTSGLPETATINSAILSLYITSDSSLDDFNVTIQDGQPTYPHSPIVVSDFNRLYYNGNGGNRSTSEISGVGWWNITLNDDGLSWIQKGSTTKLAIRSSNDISGTTPSTYEYVIFRSYEAGEDYAAKLYVVAEGGVNYLIHGPLYEDGSVADAFVNLTIKQPFEADYEFTLNGTDGVADMANISLFQIASYLTWNITVTGNYTRTYYFLPTATFEEVWIFVPDPTKAWYPYTFTIADFYGMENPYLESTVALNGTTRIVERKSLATVGSVAFSMVQWSHYGLRFRCDQGILTQSFDAETSYTTNLQVLPGAFPTTSYSMPTVQIERINGSIIEITYVDPTESTAWFYYSITYGDTVEATDNVTTNSYSVNWTSAVSEVDYLVDAQAYSGKLYQWLITSSAPIDTSNPWSGLFESLGTFPSGFEPMYIPAIVIILAVLGIFSYFSAGIGCVLAWIVTGVFMLMGWYSMGVPTFAFAGFASVLVAFSEAKKQEREV